MSQQSHYWAYPEKPWFKKIYVPQCSLQHYLQQPGRGSSLNVHQQKNGQRRCGTYNGILVIKRNRIVSSAEMWMDPETVIQTKVNQREKQILYINTYIWNLEKCYWWTYFQGRNKDTEVEDGLVGTVREGEVGTNWESSIEIYTLPCVKQIASGKLLYNTGSSTQCSVTT